MLYSIVLIFFFSFGCPSTQTSAAGNLSVLNNMVSINFIPRKKDLDIYGDVNITVTESSGGALERVGICSYLIFLVPHEEQFMATRYS